MQSGPQWRWLTMPSACVIDSVFIVCGPNIAFSCETTSWLLVVQHTVYESPSPSQGLMGAVWWGPRFPPPPPSLTPALCPANLQATTEQRNSVSRSAPILAPCSWLGPLLAQAISANYVAIQGSRELRLRRPAEAQGGKWLWHALPLPIWGPEATPGGCRGSERQTSLYSCQKLCKAQDRWGCHESNDRIHVTIL